MLNLLIQAVHWWGPQGRWDPVGEPVIPILSRRRKSSRRSPGEIAASPRPVPSVPCPCPVRALSVPCPCRPRPFGDKDPLGDGMAAQLAKCQIIRWMSGGCQVDVRWMSGRCQVDVRWMSGGCQVDVRWMSGGCQWMSGGCQWSHRLFCSWPRDMLGCRSVDSTDWNELWILKYAIHIIYFFFYCYIYTHIYWTWSALFAPCSIFHMVQSQRSTVGSATFASIPQLGRIAT